ncbi:MAG TPA: TonB family protein [Thermoanaerobaculia bacterium]|nr:TonB family protein [Thermoanaerobaculia bacterium]
MAEQILVVEYEPRYIDRIRQAVSSYPVTPIFARDGEEALKALDTASPRLIVLSSILPRISTGDLIRQIRNRPAVAATPILVTISGYNGKTPKADAVRLGASDLLPKPYSETEFFGKVQEMLGLDRGGSGWTSADIGEELDRQLKVAAGQQAGSAAKKKSRSTFEDVDKMVADTLAGVRIPLARKPATDEPVETKPGSQLVDLDKLLEDTLSGLERRRAEDASAFHTAALPEDGSAEERHDDDTSDGIRFGQYVLLEKIASGGMAEVWKARMRGVEGFQKIVAIKKILPHLSDNSDFVEMFVDEAKLAAQLNHSNIIHIYDLGRIAKSYYIAMEYIDGHDLKSIMNTAEERDQRLPVELALFIASKTAAALDYAHRKRDFDEKEMELVHRDVSPQNVLISYEGDIKLCDFGIAKAASKASHTLSGALKGKLQYMSPEQAWGRRIDRRSDIFALGTVLFELLTGRKLFVGENELSVLEQVRQARVVAPSTLNEDVTPEIDAIVMKALQGEPSSRYQTAGELVKDLDAIVYNFWPTPTNADVAIYMHHLYTPDSVGVADPAVADEPDPSSEAGDAGLTPVESIQETADIEMPSELVAEPAIAAESQPQPQPQPAIATPVMFTASEPAKKRGFGIVPIAAGILLLITTAATASYIVWNGRSNDQTPALMASTAAPLQRTVPVPANQTPLVSGGEALPVSETVDPTVIDGSDQARIDQEVQRRLEAERLRLENQRALQLAASRPQQQPAAVPTAASAVQAPELTQTAVPVATPVIEATPAPPPVVPVSTPAPTPVQTPAVAQATPVATPVPVRQGDLVDSITPGLVQAAVIKQYRPPYPPMAKMQKVEGVVIVSALVSEDGKVLDVRVLRGVAQNVGINEAALDAVRRSTFKPATLNGVRVKAYKNVTVPFKL